MFIIAVDIMCRESSMHTFLCDDMHVYVTTCMYMCKCLYKHSHMKCLCACFDVGKAFLCTSMYATLPLTHIQCVLGILLFNACYVVT